jgi:hypothetical protein
MLLLTLQVVGADEDWEIAVLDYRHVSDNPGIPWV